jgi:hypothetical protein
LVVSGDAFDDNAFSQALPLVPEVTDLETILLSFPRRLRLFFIRVSKVFLVFVRAVIE